MSNLIIVTQNYWLINTKWMMVELPKSQFKSRDGWMIHVTSPETGGATKERKTPKSSVNQSIYE